MADRRTRNWETRVDDLLSLPIAYSRSRFASVFMVVTLAIHVLLYAGALDLYFSTPLVSDISRTHRASLSQPPAKRVVLFVVDGLGFKGLFHSDLRSAPHLRQVVRERGAWGVSVARTPTLSRPGHLSLLSGVYELMHGITRGRHFNPFDSVVNRSSASFLFGEGEIVAMFQHPGRDVHVFSYNDNLNDFSMADPTLLDQWVFRRLDGLLSNSSRQMPKSGLLFMTHLLGVDTFSHSHTAAASELEPLLTKVDTGVARAEYHFRKVFKDEQTAFILSADHGMSAWSAHGAGDSKEEVTTPFLAWGAGIRRAGRTNVAQVDVCPLIAALLNVDFPVHSVGRVPSSLLNVSAAARRDIMRANAGQVTEQFLQLRRTTKTAVGSFFFSELPGLAPDQVKERFRRVHSLSDHAEAEALLDRLITDAVDGLYRLHRLHAVSDKVFLSALFLVLLSVLGLGCVEEPDTEDAPRVTRLELTGFGSLLASQFLLTIVTRRSAVQLTAWVVLVLLSWSVYRRRARLRTLVAAVRRSRGLPVCLLLLEAVVAGFLDRRIICVAVLGHAAWQLRTTKDGGKMRERRWFAAGSVLCAVFPLLPTVGMLRSVLLVSLGSVLTAAASVLFLLITGHTERRPARVLLILQVLLLLSSCVVHNRAHLSIQALQGLPGGTILATRALLLLSLLAAAIVSLLATPTAVLVSLWLSIAVTFTLCSLAFETLFVFVFGLTLGAWLKLHEDGDVPVHRHALSYIVFVFVSLFGIGNFPSISSYDPQMVLCFQSVFDLAVMGIIMFLRNMLPVQMVTSPFLVLTGSSKLLHRYRLAILLLDVVGVQFYLRLHSTRDYLYLAAMVNQLSISMAFIVMVTLCFVVHRWIVDHRL